MNDPLLDPEHPDETRLEPDERRQMLLPHIAT